VTVFDASVLADALAVAGEPGQAARTALAGIDVLPAPEIFLAEVTSALRGLVLGAHLAPGRAEGAVHRLRSLRIETYPTEPFLDRIWDLRSNLTVYDACYVALAEELDVALVTADGRLLQATGPRCPILTPAAFAAGTA